MRTFAVSALMTGLLTVAASAADVPATLPKPDDSVGDTSKPVKVYILAGQSNMVGFGRLKGASPMYKSIFLSADPSIMPARMPVGTTAMLPHKLYKGSDAKAELAKAHGCDALADAVRRRAEESRRRGSAPRYSPGCRLAGSTPTVH